MNLSFLTGAGTFGKHNNEDVLNWQVLMLSQLFCIQQMDNMA